MAFSMLFKSSVTMNRLLSQQAVKFATQTSSTQLSTSLLSAVKPVNATPIINSIRALRTSPIRLSAAKGSDHSKIWVVERFTSVALIPLVPLAIMAPNKVFDSLLAILVTAHSFWGLEAVTLDYVRANVLGPVIPKLAIGLVYLISAATLGGLFYIITHDIGLGNTIRSFWAIKSEKA